MNVCWLGKQLKKVQLIETIMLDHHLIQHSTDTNISYSHRLTYIWIEDSLVDVSKLPLPYFVLKEHLLRVDGLAKERCVSLSHCRVLTRVCV